MDIPREYLTKAQVQEYLQISKATVERLMKEGLPHYKLARRVLFKKAAVDAWLESKVVKK